MKNKIVKNYFYNMIYQLLLIFLPLITLPYLSRILGAKGIGIYSYVVAITAYFILIGTLGLNLYGQKEIAYVQEDSEKRTNKFIEIFSLKCITLTISLIVFICFFTLNGEYSYFYRILIIEIIGNIFDITWFFQGMEDFKKTVIRNSLIKIISTILIFMLIKSYNDLKIYFLIYALSIFLGNLSMWFYLPKYIKLKDIKILKKDSIFFHFKPAFLLLIPQVATQIYTVLDKSMIGFLSTNISEVGFYDNAQKIIKVGITLVTALGVVMLPRISNFFANGQKEKITDYITKSFSLVFLLSFPIIMGLNITVDEFVPIFFGDGFEKTALLIKVISPVILFIGISNVLGIQYLLPTQKNKPYIIAVICGAITNIILNFVLIRYFESIGASIATIGAEFVVMAIEIIYLRNEFNWKKIIYNSLKYLVAALIMFLCCFVINYLNLNGLIKMLIKIAIGAASYIIVLLIIREEFLMTTLLKIRRNIHETKKIF